MSGNSYFKLWYVQLEPLDLRKDWNVAKLLQKSINCHNPGQSGQSRAELSNLDRYYYRKINPSVMKHPVAWAIRKIDIFDNYFGGEAACEAIKLPKTKCLFVLRTNYLALIVIIL